MKKEVREWYGAGLWPLSIIDLLCYYSFVFFRTSHMHNHTLWTLLCLAFS